ncbi:MAG: winged helix-turn-helix domain-containing protein [Steroidobacteraceae bacterium]
MSTRLRRQPSRPSPTAGLAHREQAAPRAPEIRFRVDFDDRCSVGVGKIRLLEAIEHTGSLSQAARDIGMSYRRAWLLIGSMNAEFDTPVISATVGGSGGGGAKLTSFGRELIEAYRKLETRLVLLTANYMGKFAAHAIGRPRRSAAGGIPSRKTIAKSLKRGSPR